MIDFGIGLSQTIANIKYPRKTMIGGGGTYGTSADKIGTTVNSGVAVIPAGSVSVVVAHGLIGTPKITLGYDSFVFVKRSVDATNITISIDAPQITDTNFDWMATL